MRVPYGYKATSIRNGKCNLEVVPEKAEVLKVMFDLYINQGFNFQKIADFLNEKEIKTPRGLEKWSVGQVYQVMQNPIHSDKLPEHINGNFHGIIDPETFEKFQKEIFKNKVKNFDTMSKGSRIIHPYGYKVITRKDGKRILEIVPEKAKIVKLIFDLRLKGYSYVKISEIVTRSGAKPPRGGDWTERILYKIIQNRHYVGRIGGKYDIPQIISESTFKGVQKINNSEYTISKDRSLKRNPFAGILKCKCHNSAMSLNYNRTLECRKIGCKQVRTTIEIFEKIFVEKLKLLKSDNEIIQYIINNYDNIPVLEKNMILNQVIDKITYDRSSKDKPVEIEIFLK